MRSYNLYKLVQNGILIGKTTYMDLIVTGNVKFLNDKKW